MKIYNLFVFLKNSFLKSAIQINFTIIIVIINLMNLYFIPKRTPNA